MDGKEQVPQVYFTTKATAIYLITADLGALHNTLNITDRCYRRVLLILESAPLDQPLLGRGDKLGRHVEVTVRIELYAVGVDAVDGMNQQVLAVVHPVAGHFDEDSWTVSFGHQLQTQVSLYVLVEDIAPHYELGYLPQHDLHCAIHPWSAGSRKAMVGPQDVLVLRAHLPLEMVGDSLVAHAEHGDLLQHSRQS
ncbi:hypothetical protein H257_14683 [Aphanomyces astaci]|uniref:Uncharacterized protein n=1 Tax=Aphanomyces astaci TaxID=112090 RepID=W4FS62_APHAT|nr:hypothetical protein H257_14683 [Aphanomyces astaci]ETV69659.1 hypothetical protein H257_14683 [Aphanomyces astaci]|eukprot:XP_009840875.1 hypothetical protein H257_14683 [Aphanomyces astaci]